MRAVLAHVQLHVYDDYGHKRSSMHQKSSVDKTTQPGFCDVDYCCCSKLSNLNSPLPCSHHGNLEVSRSFTNGRTNHARKQKQR